MHKGTVSHEEKETNDTNPVIAYLPGWRKVKRHRAGKRNPGKIWQPFEL